MVRTDKEYVREHMRRFERWADVAKDPPYDPEDRGVPPDMFDGAVNSDGWVDWKLLPSTVSEEEFSGLENRFGVRFPPLFRAYYTTFFHMFDQFNNGQEIGAVSSFLSNLS